MLNIIEEWRPGCYCAAITQLCDRHEECLPDEVSRIPAQWVWFAWEPMDKALPFVTPQGWGLSPRDPIDDLAEDLGDVALYVLKETEADWVTLLDIVLVCGDCPPWMRRLVKDLQRTKRREAHKRFVFDFGVSDDFAFERFLKRATEDAMDP